MTLIPVFWHMALLLPALDAVHDKLDLLKHSDIASRFCYPVVTILYVEHRTCLHTLRSSSGAFRRNAGILADLLGQFPLGLLHCLKSICSECSSLLFC